MVQCVGTSVARDGDDALRDLLDDGVHVDRARLERHAVHQRPARVAQRVAHRADAFGRDRGLEAVGRGLVLVARQLLHVVDGGGPRNVTEWFEFGGHRPSSARDCSASLSANGTEI